MWARLEDNITSRKGRGDRSNILERILDRR